MLTVAALVLLTVAPKASANELTVFPGAVQSVAAPDGSGRRIFYRPHIALDGSQASPVFFDDGKGSVRRVATVSRNMGVEWSPDGRRVFLQDNWGSNIADCYAMTMTSAGMRGFSLLKLIRRTPGRPMGPEQPYVAHYYVHCDEWRGSDQIAGALDGHVDTSPFRTFSHPFVYDARTGKLQWR